jgi:formate hydrogenlyase subunit 4
MDIMAIARSFINAAVFLLVAPLFDGIVRKITARLQSRQGPPVVQPYYDLLKLLGKQRIVSAPNAGFRIAPPMALAAVVAVLVLVPLGARPSGLGSRADAVAVIYLLTFGGVAILLGALSSRNPFALIGASREMITMIMVEPVLAMTLVLGAVRGGGLGLGTGAGSSFYGVAGAGFSVSSVLMLAVYLAALQAFVARQPFDIAEAEVELLEGPYIEFSGPDFALFRYAMMLKQAFYAFLFAAAFFPVVETGFYAANVLVQLVEMLAVVGLVAVVGATNPRFRIDQAVRYYAALGAAALAAVGLGVLGY